MQQHAVIADWDPGTGSLDLATLSGLYAAGRLTPEDIVNAVYDRIEARIGKDRIESLLDDVEAALEALEHEGRD